MSNTVCFKLKVIELAEATSNRNAGKELGINEKLVWDLDEVHWPELEVFRYSKKATYVSR